MLLLRSVDQFAPIYIVCVDLHDHARCYNQPYFRDPALRCISTKMHGGKYLRAEIVHKKGFNLISDPLYNKGLAFPQTERDRLSIRGIVPPAT